MDLVWIVVPSDQSYASKIKLFKTIHSSTHWIQTASAACRGVPGVKGNHLTHPYIMYSDVIFLITPILIDLIDTDFQ